MTEYLIVIEQVEDGSGYGAFAPDLPGCVATGRTREEAKERMAFSIPLHIQSLRTHGEAVPPPTSTADSVRVAA
jgi:predicted RNase H-like HicB family nuclease